MNQLDAPPARTRAIGSTILAAAAVATLGAPEWVCTIQPPEILGELARSSLVAFVLSRLLARARARTWSEALRIGAGVCLFQAVILVGAVLHEHKPLAAYATRAAYCIGTTLAAVAVLHLLDGSACGEPAREANDVNYKAVALAAVAAIAVGGLWYSPLLFGGVWAHLESSASAGPAMSPVEGIGELARSATVAYVLSRFILAFRLSVRGAALLGAAMWLGFHATLLLFSVVHEDMPLQLFAIHAGHGLANDVIIAAIVGAWPLSVGRRLGDPSLAVRR